LNTWLSVVVVAVVRVQEVEEVLVVINHQHCQFRQALHILLQLVEEDLAEQYIN
jgi:hypothetical protein